MLALTPGPEAELSFPPLAVPVSAHHLGTERSVRCRREGSISTKKIRSKAEVGYEDYDRKMKSEASRVDPDGERR